MATAIKVSETPQDLSPETGMSHNIRIETETSSVRGFMRPSRQLFYNEFNDLFWFFHGNEMSGFGNKPVRAVLELGGGFLEIHERTIGALLSLEDEYRAGNFRQHGPGVIAHSAHEQRGFFLGRTGQFQLPGIQGNRACSI